MSPVQLFGLGAALAAVAVVASARADLVSTAKIALFVAVFVCQT